MQTLDVPQLIEMLAKAGQVTMLITIGAGVILLLMGRKSARPACGILGLAVGGATAMIIPTFTSDANLTPIILVVGCVIGFVAAWFMFRMFMGFSCAVLLALALPVACLMWHDRMPPVSIDLQDDTEAPQPTTNASPATRSLFESSLFGEAAAEPQPAVPEPFADEASDSTTAENATADELADDVGNLFTFDEKEIASRATTWLGEEAAGHVRSRYEKQSQSIEQWWENLGRNKHEQLLKFSLAGIAVGLIIGIVAPYWGAALFSSLLGSTMTVFGALGWFAIQKQDPIVESLPDSSEIVMIVGLITVAGTLLQWIIWTRKADK